MRRREEESSLELLLDTMCNTFGGVMFIAITLAVVIAGRQIAPKHEEKSRITDVRQLQTEINALEIALQKTLEETASLEKEREAIRQDSRMQLISEIALIEKKLQNAELVKKLETGKTAAADAEKISLEIELRKLQKKLQVLTAQRDEVDRKLAEERSRIDELKQKIRTAAPMTLTFHILAEKKEAPYFIFLRNDQAWRVGPLRINGQWQAEPDALMASNGNIFTFTVLPEKGCPVWERDALGGSFNRLLSAVPADRIPMFVVEPSSAKTFSKVRQLLKKQNFRHGFVMYETLENFSLIRTNDAHYEY